MRPHQPQILRGKRAASQEGGGGKRRAKSLGGRRVSFAPDDELETMHLFTVGVWCFERRQLGHAWPAAAARAGGRTLVRGGKRAAAPHGRVRRVRGALPLSRDRRRNLGGSRLFLCLRRVTTPAGAHPGCNKTYATPLRTPSVAAL
jgi:hypothetical protein